MVATAAVTGSAACLRDEPSACTRNTTVHRLGATVRSACPVTVIVTGGWVMRTSVPARAVPVGQTARATVGTAESDLPGVAFVPL